MEQSIAVLRGGVTIANPTLGSKRAISPVDLAVYPDRLAFTGFPVFGIRPVTVTEQRESIEQIYPLIVRSVWRFHPGLGGKYLIRVTTKCSNVFEGSLSYWFSFLVPLPEVVLGLLASAGYPVDREPRIAGLMSGVDRKLPQNPAK
jgi:hypothetical protein